MPSWWIQAAWRGESAGSRARVSWISEASWSQAPQVCSWLTDRLGDLAGVLGVPGLQQVVAGLQQVMHIGGLVLRPDPDPPPPVGGRLPVRLGQPLAGLAGGPAGQLGGGPPVHEEPRLPAVAADGQQAGGLAGGDLLGQAGTRPERRHRRPVQLGEVRRQLRPDVAGDARQVEGLVHGDPGGGQDAR